MHDAPIVALQVPAAYLAAFALVALALGVVVAIALITIAVRAGSLLSEVRQATKGHATLTLAVDGLAGRVSELERDAGPRLRAITHHDQG